VRSDNGSEFKNTWIDELCDEYGIKHQFSAKYTLQSNGLVEKKNRILIDMARSMLSEYNVSHFFGLKLSTRLASITTAFIVINL
jgi:transposase InsO family protein